MALSIPEALSLIFVCRKDKLLYKPVKHDSEFQHDISTKLVIMANHHPLSFFYGLFTQFFLAPQLSIHTADNHGRAC